MFILFYRHILASIAKIDRLPASNNLETLRILQDAWDQVEIYHSVADSYKFSTKVMYILSLLVGIVIKTLSISSIMTHYSSRIPTLVISFLSTAIASYVTFASPAVRWQQLRMAALSIESNIWTFRTRSGVYRVNGEGFDNSPEQLLADSIKDIKATVLEGIY